MSFSKSTFEVNFGKMHTEWEVATLQEVCLKEKGSIISGPFGSNISKKYFVDYGVPVIRGNNLTKDWVKFVDEGFVFVTEEKAESLKTYARINDLVFTAAGTIGQVGIINNKCKYKEYIISNKQLRATPDTNIVDPLYTYYWFSNPKMDTYINKLNTGSTIPLINLTILKGLPIPLPMIKEQKAIASILSSLDEKIELNNQMNKTLEEMAQALFKRWFVDFEFPNEDGEPYKSSCGEMVDSELGMIPRGWEVTTIGDLGRVVTGKTPSTKEAENFGEEFNFITPRDIDGNIFIQQTERKLSLQGASKIENYKVKPYSIGVSCIGSDLGEVYVTDDVAFTNQQINTLELKEIEKYPYMYILLKNMKSDFKNMAGGSAVPIINKTSFSNITVLIPKEMIMDKFNASVGYFLEQIKKNLKENIGLIQIRDTLLPKLMSGEIKVTDLQN